MEIRIIMFIRFITAVIIILFSFDGLAEDKINKTSTSRHDMAKSHIKASEPINVDIYAVLDRVFDINISERSYKAEAEVILKWRPSKDDLNIISKLKEHHYSGSHAQEILEQIWHPEFIVKSELSRREQLFRTVSINPDGSIEIFEKFSTYLPIKSEMTSYPFGNLDLNIGMVAFKHDSSEMLFKPVSFSIGHKDSNDSIGHIDRNDNVIIGNWSLLGKSMDTLLDNRLSSNHDIYSKLSLSFTLKHDFLDSLQKIFIPILGVLFISLMLNTFSSMRFKENIDMRVMGQISLLLTTFALKFTLSDDIPSTHYLTLIDYLFIITIIVVIFNLLFSVVLGEYYLDGGGDKIRKIEIISDYAAPIITLGVVICIFYLNIN